MPRQSRRQRDFPTTKEVLQKGLPPVSEFENSSEKSFSNDDFYDHLRCEIENQDMIGDSSYSLKLQNRDQEVVDPFEELIGNNFKQNLEQDQEKSLVEVSSSSISSSNELNSNQDNLFNVIDFKSNSLSVFQQKKPKNRQKSMQQNFYLKIRGLIASYLRMEVKKKKLIVPEELMEHIKVGFNGSSTRFFSLFRQQFFRPFLQEMFKNKFLQRELQISKGNQLWTSYIDMVDLLEEDFKAGRRPVMTTRRLSQITLLHVEDVDISAIC